ncbi:hypothetical protein TNCV_1975991 [Trichonephila clavipes]|nr:hypothetical protein TNCV_1975991 [Trichonephila clavipes]
MFWVKGRRLKGRCERNPASAKYREMVEGTTGSLHFVDKFFTATNRCFQLCLYVAVDDLLLAAPAREDCLALAATIGQPDCTLSAAVRPFFPFSSRPEENLKHTKKDGTDKDYTTNT